jgi:hypothetical protein
MSVVIAAIVIISGAAVMYRQGTKRLDIIHHLVNSNLTKVQADLEIALDRIQTLETILTRERSD